MKLNSILLVLIFPFAFGGCGKSPSPASLTDLRCENLTDPCGIGTTLPRLSWKLKSEAAGTGQKGYQVIVASRKELLSEEKADLWNSGKVSSAESVLVPYAGRELQSRSVCFWQARIWDERNRVTEWSPAAEFTVGLLDRNDWHASYIGLPGSENGNVSPQLRQAFTINKKGEKIMLHVNSLGYHEAYVNGEKAGNKVLTPAVSQFSMRSHVIAYDITDMVKEGRNDIILWTGHGWYTRGLPGVAGDRPLVRAQAEQIIDGRWETVVGTDSTWKGRNSGYSRIGTWHSGDYGGEKVNAKLLLPDLKSLTADAAEWSPVLVSADPGYEATPQITELNAIREIIPADSIWPVGNGKWLIDMGTTLTGWVSVGFPDLVPGQEIIMEYSDHFDQDGKLADQGQEDRYIACGRKGETFTDKFNYHGFRYILISNLKTAPLKKDINGYLIHTDYRLASSFECSDPDLNAIHNMIFYTLRCLSVGGDLVDCPQIERLGYGGDGNASTLTAQTMFDLGPLYSNWLQAWADCIRDDGGMPHTAPNPYPAGGGPYWCGFIITASWKTYVSYGDMRILEKYYPVMQKWLGYVDKYSSSGLLEPWPETDYRSWYLGDWAVPGGINQNDPGSISLVNNCFISVCYETMKHIAGVLGKEGDAEMYSQKEEKLKALINSRLYNEDKKIYGSGSQIDLTYPLLASVAPESLRQAVRDSLLNVIQVKHSGHIACGLVGIPVFTEWAVRDHEADLVYSMLKKREYPGYLYMIDNGATTTWEHWNGARSRIHNCYNGIGSWFYEAVGGIRPDEDFPGYRKFTVDPQIPDGVSWARVSKETPYGTVMVNWKLTDGLFRMDLTVPAGSSARIIIPAKTEHFIIDGSRKTGGKPIETGSGIHTLEWPYKKL